MRFVDEYRGVEDIQRLLNHIHHQLKSLPFTPEKPLHIMEVCGGHTHAIFKFGLDKLLPRAIEFIHGPGCPVCVLPMARIDACIEIAQQPDVIFCTFGDAIRVPGKQGSLLDARRRGADIRMVYSPTDALNLAKNHPNKHVVFFALGFETTMPATAFTLMQARQEQVNNFSIFCQHITIIPTLTSLLNQPDILVDAFLAPGHVSMIIGSTPYEFISQQHQKGVVISGFEPVDILQSIVMLLDQYINQCPKVENQYRRIVTAKGNELAQQAMQQVFTLRDSSEWRGLGMIEHSGVTLSADYQQFDGEKHFTLSDHQSHEHPKTRCGDVLTGRCKPADCPLFATSCSPDQAIGALMVSSEGACAAWYQYRLNEIYSNENSSPL